MKNFTLIVIMMLSVSYFTNAQTCDFTSSLTATSPTSQTLSTSGNVLSATAAYQNGGVAGVNISYSWSDGGGWYIGNPGYSWSSNISRTVTASGSYTLTYNVIEEDEEQDDLVGCTATYSITFEVTEILEVPCGNNGNKIAICHKGKTICISRSALEAHMAHGDADVPCD